MSLKVIEIIKRAQKEVETNPSEARKYLKGYTPLNDELAGIVTLALIKTCDEVDEKDIQGLQKFYDIFKEYGVVDGRISAEEILYCN